jgi:ABC-2 type transport system ATP-binding protein
MPAGAIRLRGVSRRYRLLLERNATLKETILRRKRAVTRDVWALREVDLDIAPGTALGVVGANGAGKSTLLKVLAGIIPPDGGTVETQGKVVSLLELGAGFHPDFSGRENVVLNASIHGMTRREVDSRMDAIVEFAELERFIDAPVRTYSSGMYMRLGFAVAAELEPDILLLDEVLAVGDAAFQQKCLGRIADFQRAGVTIVFVSHSAQAVEHVCNRAIWLSGGVVMMNDDPETVLKAYNRGLAGSGPSKGAVEIDAEDWRSSRITAVRCANAVGPTERFLSGEPFSVEIDYEVVEPVTPLVKLEIATVDGALIGGTDNRTDLEEAGLTPGPRTARFELPALPLLEGRFAITVGLESPDGVVPFHRLERCVEFGVFAQDRGYGPVALPGTWTVSTRLRAGTVS